MIEPEKNSERVPFFKSLLRYNLSAVTATATDFAILSFLHYVLDVFYVTATAFGSLGGAIVAFLLGRNWCFQNTDGSISKQALRFMMISGLSLVLNTSGIAFFKEIVGIQHVLVARVCVSLFVGLFVNFPFQRYFVYR